MFKKYIKSAVAVLVLSLLIALLSLLEHQTMFERSVIGTKIFNRSLEKGAYIDRIVILIPNKKPTDIVLQKNSVWSLKNYNMYPANRGMINKLLTSINAAEFEKKENITLNVTNYPVIKTYVGEEVQDYVMIGETTADNKFMFIQKIGQANAWLTKEIFDLNLPDYVWFESSLAQLKTEDVARIVLNGTGYDFEYVRNTPQEHFKANENVLVDLKWLADLAFGAKFIDVRNEESFDRQRFVHERKILFEMFDGLIAEFVFYTNLSDYWMKINLLKSPLISNKANAYIKNNQDLFAGWYFNLEPKLGKKLFLVKQSDE